MDNINLQTKKIFLYARKSTDEPERQILSIEAQLFELREYARKEGLNIVREFVESKTAKEPGREIFNDMVASIEKNEAEGILAWHPDRLARNSIDGGRIIYLVDTGKISALKFPTFWFDPTPQGKFMLSIAFGQSKYYVDNLSDLSEGVFARRIHFKSPLDIFCLFLVHGDTAGVFIVYIAKWRPSGPYSISQLLANTSLYIFRKIIHIIF